MITLTGFHCFNVWVEQIKLNFPVKDVFYLQNILLYLQIMNVLSKPTLVEFLNPGEIDCAKVAHKWDFFSSGEF